MYTQLLHQQWKKTVRSKYFQQGWGVKILIGFLIIYFGLAFIALGVFLPEILKETHPAAPVLTDVFSGFILHYLLVDLVIRFFLQDLTVLSIQHYLILPIRKSRIIHFLLQTSVFSFFNLLPLFLLIPFAIRVVSDEFGLLHAGIWLLSMYSFALANHFLAIYIKRMLAVKQWIFIAFAAVVAFLFAGDYFKWFSLQDISGMLFSSFSMYSWLILISLAVMIIFYGMNFSFLKKYTHLDLWEKKKATNIHTERFSFLESKGIIGSMVANELKLITRNKRTKSVLFITFFFAFYGLIFYTNPIYNDKMGWLIFTGIFMTGIFMINYGQFMIGWEGAYFDGILTRSYPMRDFFKAKFWLIVTSCVVTYILTLPYAYFGWDAFLINTATFIYNIGLNSFILLYAATYNKKRIELSRSQAFNYQGTSATQFIIVLPLMVLPIIIFLSFNIFGKPYLGLAALALVGIISLMFSNYWFKAIIHNFKEKKYINAEGFRGKG